MRYRTATALAAAFLVSAGAFVPLAQADEKKDLSSLRACLGEKTSDERGCIGVIADPCQEEPEGSTTVGVTECLTREGDAWDALLNERYAKQVSIAKAADAELKADPATSDATSVLESLKTAQRAWISFRDAECERQWASFQGGTIAQNIGAACQRDLTAERAIDLNPNEGQDG